MAPYAAGGHSTNVFSSLNNCHVTPDDEIVSGSCRLKSIGVWSVIAPCSCARGSTYKIIT
jgi:hypothetical protein